MIYTILVMPVLVVLLTMWIAQRFGKLGVTAKKWWLFAHVMAVAVYFSGVLGTLLLVLLTKMTADPQLIAAAAHFTEHFDRFLIIPGAIISLITGIVLAVRTAWGLMNYYWVMAKWIGNIALIQFGSTVQDSLAGSFVRATASQGAYAESPVFLASRQLLFLALGGIIAVMVFLVGISYLKPWGKRSPATDWRKL